MKLWKIIAALILAICCITPVFAEDVEKLLFLVVEKGEVVASNTRTGRFDRLELSAKERIREYKVANAVAVVVTNQRYAAYGVLIGGWQSIRVRAQEKTVSIEAAEISQAFATGVAESMVSSGSTGYDRKVWESLTHFYEVDAWLPRNYVMVNKDVWSDVSKTNKNVILGCAELAEYAGRYYSEELDTEWELVVRDDALYLEDADDALTPLVKDEFTVDSLDITYTRDEAGRVNGLTVDAGRARGIYFARRAN